MEMKVAHGNTQASFFPSSCREKQPDREQQFMEDKKRKKDDKKKKEAAQKVSLSFLFMHHF